MLSHVTLATSCRDVTPWRAFARAASRISLMPFCVAAKRISSVGLRSTIICLISGVSVSTSAATVRP